ncbi:MAG TPA: PRC-barrel domain containing protein, partial [Pseudomonadaceae bacterium]|nr:PRC-barrel domain containing protein [Pseudomonadaceae bacterium]
MQNGNPKVLSAGSLSKDKVQNLSGESLGDIEDLMIDLGTGRVAYAVLSFGGVLGMGNKLFAIPWQAMNLDTDNQVFLLDVNKESLEQAPGFDKDDWPDMSDPRWGTGIHSHY